MAGMGNLGVEKERLEASFFKTSKLCVNGNVG